MVHEEAGLDLMFHAGLGLELVAAPHRMGFESFVQWLAADALHRQAEGVVECGFREIAHLLAVDGPLNDLRARRGLVAGDIARGSLRPAGQDGVDVLLLLVG
ncbi:hypothetical protein D9M68_728570 [compost metagenome]